MHHKYIPVVDGKPKYARILIKKHTHIKMKYSTKDKKTLMKMLSVMLEDGQDGIEWMDVTLDWDIVNDDSEIPPYYVPIKTTRYTINITVKEDTEL